LYGAPGHGEEEKNETIKLKIICVARNLFAPDKICIHTHTYITKAVNLTHYFH